MSTTEILTASCVILFGSVVRSLTGFGFAIFSLPFLLIWFDPKLAVPTLVLLAVSTNFILIIESYKYAKIKDISYILLGGVMGLPLGTYVLAEFSSQYLKIAINVLVITLAILLFIGLKITIRRKQMARLSVGLVSGVVGGSTGLGGPPVVLYGVNEDWPKNRFRANLIIYFSLYGIAMFFSYFVFKLFTQEVVKLALITFPSLIVGLVAGIWLKNKINQRTFNAVVLILVLVGGITGIVRSL